MLDLNSNKKERIRYPPRLYYPDEGEWFCEKSDKDIIEYLESQQGKEQLWDSEEIELQKSKSRDRNLIDNQFSFELEKLNTNLLKQQFIINKLYYTLQSLDDKLEIIINLLGPTIKDIKKSQKLENHFYVTTLTGKPKKTSIQFNNAEEKIAHFKKRIKEIGSISKRSAIEEE